MSEIFKYKYLAVRKFYTKIFLENKNCVDSTKETFEYFKCNLYKRDIISVAIYSSVLCQFRIIKFSDKKYNLGNLEDLIYFYNELINIYETQIKSFDNFDLSELEEECLKENFYICKEDFEKIKSEYSKLD